MHSGGARGGCGAKGGHGAGSQILACNTLIPARHTRVGCETPTYYGWGNTTTTAADQVAIVRTLAYRNRVRGRGRNYVLAVLTTDDPAGPGTAGLDYGISTIQGVSQRIWANLAPRPRPLDRRHRAPAPRSITRR